jgi:hypothetical protein
MIKLCSRHLKDIRVQKLTTEAGFRLSYSRFKQPDISDTLTAAVGINLILVRLEDVIQT